MDWGQAFAKRRVVLDERDGESGPYVDVEGELARLMEEEVEVAPSEGPGLGLDEQAQLLLDESSSPPLSSSSPSSPSSSDGESAAAGAGVATARRGFPWGPAPWKLAPIMSNVGGPTPVQIGWGATCGCHKNVADGNSIQCKKQIVAGQKMSLDEARLRMKLWLLKGTDIVNSESSISRDQHVRLINARDLELCPESDADARARALEREVG